MYKIQFIGNLNQSAEFASRWRRETASLQVDEGKRLAKQIKQSYNLSDESSVPGKTLSPRAREQNSLRQKIYEQKDKAKKSRRENKVNSEPISQGSKKIVTVESGYGDSKKAKAILTSEGKLSLDKLRERASKRRPIIPQTETSKINQSSKLLSSAKKFLGKNKLGIGLAGAAALGGIGYGIARKMRSDKGKKRGFYK